ncbi:MAG: ATP-binding protein [bacterium]
MTSTHAINFSWLVKLRWGFIAGQLALIVLVAGALGIAGPIGWLLVVVAAEVAFNLGLARWSAAHAEHIAERHLAVVMMADVLTLTVLLALSGGSFNPFSALYLVHVALAAVILTPAWTWALVALGMTSFGSLFLVGSSSSASHHGMHGGDTPVGLHLYGMWLAFGLAAAFIVYFIQRVRRALTERDRDLARAREAAERGERLTSLATLAAGAAHELASPLSTIAVAAKELERTLTRTAAASEITDDARLIREQVERCRDILSQLAADAGQTLGESSEAIVLDDLIEEIVRTAPLGAVVEASIAADARGVRILGPRRTLIQAVGGLVKNAVQASPQGSPVRVSASTHASTIELRVEDHGTGMTQEVLAHAGEPFFTTKPPSGPGRGMGLGLFLARSVAERLGGGLELDSGPGRGTIARFHVRLARAS